MADFFPASSASFGFQITPWRSVGHPANPGTEAPSLLALMWITREDWDAFSRGSAIRRAGYSGFERNVAVAMGNWLASLEIPPEEVVAVLQEAPGDALAVLRGAVEHDEPLAAEHATRALGEAEAGLE